MIGDITMKPNEIMLYNTSVAEVQELFYMNSRKDFAEINFNRYDVKLSKKGDHTLVTLERGLLGADVKEGIIDIKMDFPHLYRDLDSIRRVEAVLKLNPGSTWWTDILNDLHTGTPLNWKVEEILSETEAKIANPDPEILAKLQQALSANPSDTFVKSLMGQFLGGRDLSDRQLEVLEQKLVGGSRRGDSPATELLNDMKSNISMSREDFMLVVQGLRDFSSLSEDDLKRLRHLVYSNGRRLQGGWSKEVVRSLLKKASHEGSLLQRIARLSRIVERLERGVI
jgi:uncharacterized protein (DUF952 family)